MLKISKIILIVLMISCSLTSYGQGVVTRSKNKIKTNTKTTFHQIKDPTIYDKGYLSDTLKNIADPIELLKIESERGDVRSQFKLGDIFHKGLGCDINIEEAIKWYKLASNQESAEAQFILGKIYEIGDGVNINYIESAFWYEKAAYNNIVEAQVKLGDYFYDGIGVEKDLEESIKWYSLALENGDESVYRRLGELYYKKSLKDNEYFDDAIQYYKKSADKGNIESFFSLGYMYESVKNYSESVRWYRKAAEQGHFYSQIAMYFSYGEGKGVDRDPNESFYWLKKAAEQDQSNLKPNELQWYRSIQCSVGTTYYDGYVLGYKIKNFRKDKNMAKLWWEKAAANGDLYAKEYLKEKFK